MQYFFAALILSFTYQTFAQSNLTNQDSTKSQNETYSSNPNYDKAFAEKLGADDYGMKMYFFVILKTGANPVSDNELISKSFRGHLDNIHRLV